MDSTMDTANTSNDSNHGSTTSNSKQDPKDKKQQFTKKQRMDMYAWCVVELELHGHTVSIKKQQTAIKKLLKKSQEKAGNSSKNDNPQLGSLARDDNNCVSENGHRAEEYLHSNPSANPPNSEPDAFMQIESHLYHVDHNGQTIIVPNSVLPEPSTKDSTSGGGGGGSCGSTSISNGSIRETNNNSKSDASAEEAKTLLQLQQEIATTQKCFSDFQKTQVLTSKMLKAVQTRFVKYYPDAPCPSRTTIKHVFTKCVEHGSVDNVKNPRKATKIPNGDEVEYLLMQEPQMSLRQMARELNVSIGTVSRRCQALGLVPESVTIKHQQMATARRQKQIKQTEQGTKTKFGSKRSK